MCGDHGSIGGGLAETGRYGNSFPLIPTSGMSGARGFETQVRGAPGLAGFETWDCSRHHKCGVRSITARRNRYFYPAHMPWGLERWHGGHDLHFITFSCYDRQPLLATAQRRDLLLEVLES